MEERIRKFLKWSLWLLFGGVALIGVVMIVDNAFHDSTTFSERVSVFTGMQYTWLGYIVLALLVWGVIYLLERGWDALRKRKR